ncbi:MAG: DUF2867 domain-containing protein [Bacteriovoracaceae bacterium]|jgi:hypothetical protein|nr:DUF2867 domain-containing protein [Bacteriovoracaceae bacterium]
MSIDSKSFNGSSSSTKRWLNSVDYSDLFSQQFHCERSIKIDDIMIVIPEILPDWLQYLALIRNSVVRPFGLGCSNLQDYNKGLKSLSYLTGEKIGPWEIVDSNERKIVVRGRDKHLDFCCGLCISLKDKKCELTFETIVYFRNFYGFCYFTIVKPFHRLIVKNLLAKVGGKVRGIRV